MSDEASSTPAAQPDSGEDGARARHLLQALQTEGSGLPEGAEVALRVLRASGFVLGWLERAKPDARALLLRLAGSEDLLEALDADIASVDAAEDDAGYMAALRGLRNRYQAAIAWRAISARDALDATLHATSAVADACIGSALRRAERLVAERHGRPHDTPGTPVETVLLGMGKLGGGELNFSSDIDLMLFYRAPGETDGDRPLANEAYYARVVQHLTRYLAEVTAQGFVYRVDWALRPFGRSGPAAMHFAAAEDYYQTHGREWERYAMIKARVVAGDAAAGRRFLNTLRPFVYRRYLDYTAIESLRELKMRIAEDVARREQQHNIKLGRGGIRDLEFIVQAFQLIRGGQEEALRQPSLRRTLRALAAGGHLPQEQVDMLDDAYVFLRRLENTLQMRSDAQVHVLPEAPAERRAVALAMDSDWEQLADRLQEVRERVAEEFDALFAGPRVERATEGAQGAVHHLWQRAVDVDEAAERLQADVDEASARRAAELVHSLRQSGLVRNMRELSQSRLGDLLCQLAAEVTGLDAPGKALVRALEVVSRLAGRGTYVSLLRESPTAREQLLRLCMASPWITNLLAQQPMLLDQLLDTRTLYEPPGRERLHAELQRRIEQIPESDQEGRMNLLRRYRQEIMLRVAAADCLADLPLPRVSDSLTWLAESILELTIAEVRREMEAEYGMPVRADGQAAGFAVIGYGKLGGIEMGYGSDLDIVFLHDAEVEEAETSGGRRSISNAQWMARYAQRVVHWLSTQTAAGRVYEVDLQLRPGGGSGLLATTLDAFSRYQRERAWTWEHQALVRARFVVGDRAIGEAFEAVRREVLCRERDPGQLAAEIREMRAKMRAHLDKSTDAAWDIKQGSGGLTDLEFVTQFLVLAHARQHPRLTDWSDQWRQTEALAAAGIIDSACADAAIEAYRELRALVHRLALDEAPAAVENGTCAGARQTVQALWRDFIDAAAGENRPSGAGGRTDAPQHG